MRDVQHVDMPSAAEFRQLMGLFTTGVCVVSIETGQGSIAAMTVNSFVSVSLDPMLVSWSIQNTNSQFALYRDADRFAISILSHEQAELARRYAARGDTLLQSSDFVQSDQGLPVIAGALGYLECDGWSHYEAGDHTMLFGEVRGLQTVSGLNTDRSPLAFFNGEFCSIANR